MEAKKIQQNKHFQSIITIFNHYRENTQIFNRKEKYVKNMVISKDGRIPTDDELENIQTNKKRRVRVKVIKFLTNSRKHYH